MRKLNILAILVGFALPLMACKPDGNNIDDNTGDPEENGGTEIVDPPAKTPKPKVLWIDAEANYFRFTQKSNIKEYVRKIADTGFNTIVVDVKSVQGYVLYPSKFAPMAKTVGESGSVEVNTSFDYLEYFIEKAHEAKLKVIVSTTMFPMGYPSRQTGPAYDDPRWEGKSCVEWTMAGLKDIRRSTSNKVAAFLSPVHEDVRQYLLDMIKEITTNYDIDGYALDYCRFCDYQSDFSDAARAEFEKYIGKPVSNWPQDVFKYDGTGAVIPGTCFQQWNAFKAKIIHDFVESAKNTIKSVKPEVEVHYWAASWWQAIYGNGQNWASAKKVQEQSKWTWGGTWWSQNYAQQGFADHVDVFQLGSYLTKVYGKEDAESIEYAINRAKELIGDDCKMYGTISCDNKDFNLASGIDICLKETDGIMIFDLVYVIKYNWWDTIKQAFAESDSTQ